LPEFVEDEFEALLECGIRAHGFLRVRCADCAPGLARPRATALTGAAAVALPGGLIRKVTTVLQWA